MDAALAHSLLRNRSERIGPAGWVTLVRATLAVGVAALAADSFGSSAQAAPLVALAAVALVLDYVDGYVARRTGTESTLGARWDGEVDAFLILALAVYVAPSAGPWVLLIGAGPLRVPGRRVAGRVDARAAAAARLAKDGCGDAGHRAGDRGSGRAAARPHPRRPRRRARPARRVVRPRRMVAVEPPVGSPAPRAAVPERDAAGTAATRTRPRGRFRGAHAARVPARVGRTRRARPAAATSHLVRS